MTLNEHRSAEVTRHPVDPSIEVCGAVVLAVVEVMGAFRSVALDILAKNDIVDPQPHYWYNLRSWLASFDTIITEVGPNTLHQVGRRVSGTAPIPPHIDSLHKAYSALDDAYYSQHRGGDIGHYHYISTGERAGTMISTTAYPTEFDRGILAALAERFEPHSLVDIELDENSESRMRGGESCTFLISW